MRRAHSQPGVDLTYIKQTGESVGDAGDQYTGLDRFGRVVDQRWRKTSTGAATDRFQYGYDRDSNPLYRDNLVNSAFGELYSYDNLNQLISAQRGTLNGTKTGLTGSASRSQSWSLDALGNFASQTTDSVTQTRSHDAQNEITSISGATTPTYDANGNLTGDETGRQFVYDAWNRLVTVKDSGGSTISSYQYDGLGRRISETKSGTTTDLYVSSADQVLEERVSGTATAQYVWSPVYVDALVLRDRDTDANGSLDERRWVQQDANWNVTALLDNSGAVVERYAYDPYGNFTIYDASWGSRSSSSYAWVYQHQGLRYDGGAGLYHARARDLSPSLGRWLQNDPAGFGAGDVDLYRAYGNGPTGALDPGGMCDNVKPVSFVDDVTKFVDQAIDYVADKAMDVFLSQTVGDILNWLDQIAAGTSHALTGGFTTELRTMLYGETATQNHKGNWFAAGVGFGTFISIMMGGLALQGQGATWAITAAAFGSTALAGYTGGLAGINIASGHGTLGDAIALGASVMTVAGMAGAFPNCFPADTPVATEHGLRPIQSIRANDRVWAFDHAVGEWRLCPVIETYQHEHDGDMVTTTVAGEEIRSTGHHPFWVVRGEALATRPQPEHVPDAPEGSRIPGRWVDAIDLRVGDVLLLRSGEEAAVDQIVVRDSREMVYNFQVDGLHCYAVGKQQVLVHNNSAAPNLIGVANKDATALGKAIKSIEIGGKQAIESVEAFGSRAGSTFRGQPNLFSDLDIYVTVKSEVANSPSKMKEVGSAVQEITELFGQAKNITVESIVEIDTVAPAHKLTLKDTPFVRLD